MVIREGVMPGTVIDRSRCCMRLFSSVLLLQALTSTTADRIQVTFYNETDHSNQPLTEGSRDCTDNDGLDIHQYYQARGRVLPITDIAPLVKSRGRSSAHTIFDLDRQGVAIGHDPRLVLKLAEQELTKKSVLQTYAATAQRVLNERHRGRCKSFQLQSVRSLYSNMYHHLSDRKRLEANHTGENLGVPFSSLMRHPKKGPCNHDEGCHTTGLHRDSDDFRDIIFWAPVYDPRPISQYPLIFGNTSTLVGLPPSDQVNADGSYGNCYDLPLMNTRQQQPVELLYWSLMELGDYTIFDGMRLFHGSGELQGLPPGAHRGRTAVSIEFRCETLELGAESEEDAILKEGDESEDDHEDNEDL